MSVFVPAHITGFFTIQDHEIPLMKGSCGVCFLLDSGVKTTVEDSDKLTVDVNKGSDIIIKEVLRIFDIKDDIKITQNIQVPIGAGFGTSAASAFSLSLALNDYFDLGYTQELCGQIAHRCEINLGAGLGDVAAQTGRGIVFRTKPGSPGIGEVESFESNLTIATKTFSELDTSSIINDDKHSQIISDEGLRFCEMFADMPTINNFLKYSYEFSSKINLMRDEVKGTIDYFNSMDGILGSSMAMLGNTVFAVSDERSVFTDCGVDNLNIYKLNNVGIVYD